MGLEIKSIMMVSDERDKLIANVQSLTNESEVNKLQRRASKRRNRDLRDEHSYVCDLLASLLDELNAREEAFKCAMKQKSAEWKEKEKAYQSRIKTLEKASTTLSVEHTNREERPSETIIGGAADSTPPPPSKNSWPGSKAKEIKRKSKMRDTGFELKHVSPKSKLSSMSKSLVGSPRTKQNFYTQSKIALCSQSNKPRDFHSCIERNKLKKKHLSPMQKLLLLDNGMCTI